MFKNIKIILQPSKVNALLFQTPARITSARPRTNTVRFNALDFLFLSGTCHCFSRLINELNYSGHTPVGTSTHGQKIDAVPLEHLQ